MSAPKASFGAVFRKMIAPIPSECLPNRATEFAFVRGVDRVSSPWMFRDELAEQLAGGLTKLFKQEANEGYQFTVSKPRPLQESDRRFTGIGINGFVPIEKGPSVYSVLNRAERREVPQSRFNHYILERSDCDIIKDPGTLVIEVRDGKRSEIDSALFVSNDGLRVWAAQRDRQFTSALSQSRLIPAPVEYGDGQPSGAHDRALGWRQRHVSGLYRSHFREIDRVSWHFAAQAKRDEEARIKGVAQTVRQQSERLVADVTSPASNEAEIIPLQHIGGIVGPTLPQQA